MLTETGRVVAVEAGELWVETIRQSTCGSCAAEKGCGHGLMNKVTDGKRAYVRVLPGSPGIEACSVDDRVRFSIPEEVILRGSFIAYLLPLLAMLGGAAAATWFFPGSQDAAAALGAMSGLAVGFAGVRWHALAHRDDPGYQPVLLEVLSQDAAPVRLV